MVKKNSLQCKIILFFVVLWSIYLRYTYMIGPFLIEDDFSYTMRSLEILENNINFNTFTFSDYRFLIYIPQTIIYYFFGFSPFTIAAWPFIVSVLHVYLVYKISLMMFCDYKTALISSFLMAIAPVNVLEIRLHPDAIFSFFLSLSVFFFLKSAVALKSNDILKFSFCSFLIINATFFIRENAFLIFPFYIFIFLYFPQNKKYWKKALLIYIIFLLFATLVLMLFPVTLVDKIDSMIKIRNTINWENAGVQIVSFPYFILLHYPLVLGYGFMYVFLIGAIYLFNTDRNRGDIAISFWFFTVYIYFEFVSPLHGLRPFEGSFRYFTPFIAPMVLLIARFINQWIFIIENKSNFNKIILLTIIIAIILENKFWPNIGLLPIALFFLYCFFARKDNDLQEKNKTNLVAVVFVIFLFVVTFMYTSVESNKYDSLTLNKLTKKIYLNLIKDESGFVVSNNFMVERKLNLFINNKFIERKNIQKKSIKYIALIRNDISEVSYKEKQINNEDYNNEIIELIKSDIFVPFAEDSTYKIFKRI